jgi:hypothetical protein
MEIVILFIQVIHFVESDFRFVKEYDTSRVVKERFCPPHERRSGKRHESLASRTTFYMTARGGERTGLT